jgi:hypothetical protein
MEGARTKSFWKCFEPLPMRRWHATLEYVESSYALASDLAPAPVSVVAACSTQMPYSSASTSPQAPIQIERMKYLAP